MNSSDAPPGPNLCPLAVASRQLILVVAFTLVGMVLLGFAGALLASDALVVLALTGLLIVPPVALAAIICGHLAKARIKKSAGALAGNKQADMGLSYGYLTYIGVIFPVLIAIPNFIKARNTPSKNACINNLRQLDGAKEQWALEHKKTAAAIPAVDDLIGADKYIKIMPTCPANGRYTLGSMSVLPVCSCLSHTLDIYYSIIASTNLNCQQSLSILQVAKQQWLSTHPSSPSPTEKELLELIQQESFRDSKPRLRCEADGTFIIGGRDEKPRCSAKEHNLP